MPTHGSGDAKPAKRCSLLALLPLLASACVGVSPDAAEDLLPREALDAFAVANGYFPRDESLPPAARLNRLTRRQLDLTAASLFPSGGLAAVSASFPKDPLQTNYEYAVHLGFTAANFTPYTRWVDQVSAAARAQPRIAISCEPSNPPPDCLRSEAERFVRRALRRAATDEQVRRYVDFFVASAGAVGMAEATAELVDLTLNAPAYLFREEISADASGLLSPVQQLQNLSYTLADAPPEAVGLSGSSAEAYVETPEALGKTVEEVLATPAARAKLTRFLVAWLEVKAADELTIAPTEFPELTPAVAAAVVDETRRFLTYQLAKESPSLNDLTQATQAFVSPATAFLYGLDPARLSGTALVELDPTKRSGVFTQPAFIASHSGPTTTRLVKRGVFFVRKVLCMPLGAVPGDVNTNIPEAAGMTERRRIEAATSEARCQGCHAYINPFGFMQENYDPIGRWRELDQGQPIDASISVDFLDEGRLETASPVTALAGFTRSARFKQCFVRQLFRYYMARDEQSSDDPLLRQMYLGFAKDDRQDIVEALRALARSPRFSRRAGL